MTLSIDFVSGAFYAGGDIGPRIEVRGLEGREAVGELYELRLLLQRGSAMTNAEIDRTLAEPCALLLSDSEGTADDTHVHGLLRRIDRIDAGGQRGAFYYAELVPRVWLLHTNHCSRAFMNQTLSDIVRSLLAEYGLQEGTDFAFRITQAEERKLEYVVQYDETDWTFVQRWLEHEGYSYWFEQSERGERLVIADGIVASASFEPPIVAAYNQANLQAATDRNAAALYDWARSHRRVTRRVGLVDYDTGQRKGVASPAASRWLLARAEVADLSLDPTTAASLGAFGCHVALADYLSYDATAGGDGVGMHLARVRAEELASGRLIYTALTQSRVMHAGSVFVLQASTDSGVAIHTDNFGPEDIERKYFVTAMEHRYGVPVRRHAEAFAAAAGANVSELTAVRADTPFRPARRTPWPRIDGVIGAHVVGPHGGASDAEQKYPFIDEHGRYQVRLPFVVHPDSSSAAGGDAFAWVRMAETMSGQSYGTHLPLHPGAEVLLAHIGGNPDRPVIVGTVPHGSMTTPVTSQDAPKSRIKSAGQVTIEVDDYSV